MSKQLLSLALFATVLLVSCKSNTCARCELVETCQTCTSSNGDSNEQCGTDGGAFDAFQADCSLNGGTITPSNGNGSVADTRELCHEDAALVNQFMDDKTDDGYTCEYFEE